MNYQYQLTYTYREGPYKADTHIETIRAYVASKAESKLWLWSS